MQAQAVLVHASIPLVLRRCVIHSPFKSAHRAYGPDRIHTAYGGHSDMFSRLLNQFSNSFEFYCHAREQFFHFPCMGKVPFPSSGLVPERTHFEPHGLKGETECKHHVSELPAGPPARSRRRFCMWQATVRRSE